MNLLDQAWRGRVPGLYVRPETPRGSSTEVQLDLAAFVGLAERGPPFVALEIDSWESYLRFFGRPGGGRMLPEAVWQFFLHGGRRCLVVRAVDPRQERTGTKTLEFSRVARWRLPFFSVPDGGALFGNSDLELHARDPGAWGNSIRLRWQTRDRSVGAAFFAKSFSNSSNPYEDIGLLSDRLLAVGTMLRVTVKHPPNSEGRQLTHQIAFVRSAEKSAVHQEKEAQWELRLSSPLSREFAGAYNTTGARWAPVGGGAPGRSAALSAVELRLDFFVEGPGRSEDFLDCAFHRGRERYLLDRLAQESLLLRPTMKDGSVAKELLDLPPHLLPVGAWQSVGSIALISPGEERPDRFIRDVLIPAGRGRIEAKSEVASFQLGYNWRQNPDPLAALAAWDEMHESLPVHLISIPDLLHDVQVEADARLSIVPPRSATFGECAARYTEEHTQVAFWPGLALGAEGNDTGARRSQAVEVYQKRLLDWCEARNSGLIMLDAPPQLDADGLRRWRVEVASRRGIAYAPYLRVIRAQSTLSTDVVHLAPSPVVAGAIADRTIRRGLSLPPANEPLEGLIGLRARGAGVSSLFLHEEEVNEIRASERGVVLSGARTTSLEPDWVFIHVRRIFDYLSRQLMIDNRWAVFEPNNFALARRLRISVERRLARLHAAGAFASEDPEQSWFVRNDDSVNTADLRDSGQIVTLVGVAISAPMEFILLRLIQSRSDFRIEEVEVL